MLMFCMQPQKLSESSDFQFHELAKSLQGWNSQTRETNLTALIVVKAEGRPGKCV